MDEKLYSIKMRASQTCGDESRHISGAERIVEEEELEQVCAGLLRRALRHSKGNPDFINLKIEKINWEELEEIEALPVTTCEVASTEEGIACMEHLMREAGISHTAQILEKMKETWGMRGGMLLDVDTLRRLEPDHDRGIRVTYMDMAGKCTGSDQKNHFQEALVLASKAAHHPNIIGELCISDDSDYVTGYFASRRQGYVRITKLKEKGSPDGGRIFLFRGSEEEAADCIRYLEQQRVLVHGMRSRQPAEEKENG